MPIKILTMTRRVKKNDVIKKCISLIIIVFWGSVALPSEMGIKDQSLRYPISPNIDKSSFSQIQDMAKSGDPVSQLYMGIFYFNGNYVDQDFHESAIWFRKSAEQQNPTAQRNLAVLYDFGLGLAQNTEEAFKWYKLAADKNEPAAHLGIAGLIMCNQLSVFPKEFRWNDVEDLENIWGNFYGGASAWAFKAVACINSKKIINPFQFWEEYSAEHIYFLNQGVLVKTIEEKTMGSDKEALSRIKSRMQSVIVHSEEVKNNFLLAAKDGEPHAQFIVSQDHFDDKYSSNLSIDEKLKMFKNAAYSFIEPHITFKYLIENKDSIPHKEYKSALMKIALQGDANAQYEIAEIYNQDNNHEKMMELLFLAAHRGHSKAIVKVIKVFLEKEEYKMLDELILNIINNNDDRFLNLIQDVMLNNIYGIQEEYLSRYLSRVSEDLLVLKGMQSQKQGRIIEAKSIFEKCNSPLAMFLNAKMLEKYEAHDLIDNRNEMLLPINLISELNISPKDLKILNLMYKSAIQGNLRAKYAISSYLLNCYWKFRMSNPFFRIGSEISRETASFILCLAHDVIFSDKWHELHGEELQFSSFFKYLVFFTQVENNIKTVS